MKTDKDETRWVFDHVVMRGCKDKIRRKCGKIYQIGMHDSDIMELHELTQQYLDLMELRGVISRMED